MSVTARADSDGTLTTRKALLTLFRLTIPTAVSFCATTLSNTAAFAFVGSHTDEMVQASHALGCSIGMTTTEHILDELGDNHTKSILYDRNILVLMIGLGLINGMDTLCPLAIGSGHPEDTFAHLIQAFAIVTGTMVPLLPLMFFSKELLLLCNQDPAIAEGASQYLKTSFPALFLICIYESLRKFLIYHQHIFMQTVVSLFSIPIQIFFLWIFVGRFNMRALGAGVSRSLTWAVMSTVLLISTFIRREDFSWSKYKKPHRVDGGRSRPAGKEFQRGGLQRDVNQEHPNTTTTTAEEEMQDMAPLSQHLCEQPEQHPPHTMITSVVAEVRAVVLPSEDSVIGSSDHRSYCCNLEVHKTEPLQDTSDKETIEPSPPFLRKSSVQLDVEHAQAKISSLSREHLYHHDHWWLGLGEFLKIAIPSTFLCIFEWLSFEAQIFEAAYLGPIELAALSAAQSLGTLIYFISLSVGVTVNSQVGQSMGKLRPLDGKTTVRAGMLASLCISLPIICILTFSRHGVVELFSSSPSIQASLRGNLLILALGVVLADSIHVIVGGAIKALYLQWHAAIFDLIGLLGIMQTVGLALAYYTTLRGKGFIIGTAIGLFCVDVSYLIMLFCCTHWPTRATYLVNRRLRNKFTASLSER